MHIEGSYTFHAPREAVWDAIMEKHRALNDRQASRRVRCESAARAGRDALEIMAYADMTLSDWCGRKYVSGRPGDRCSLL